MKIAQLRSVVTAALIGVLAIGFSTTSVADPFSITYNGTIGTEHSSDFFPGVNEGESYSLTLVFDNGGTDALSQQWDAANLTCAFFLVNDAQDVQFYQDLTVPTADESVSGNITTDGAGVLTANFTYLVYHGILPAEYDNVGIDPQGEVDWYANDYNDVFFDDVDAFGDAAGGILMAPANWSDPTPYNGTCGTSLVVPEAAAIPTMSAWGLILLTGLLAWIGFARRRNLMS